MHHHAGDDCCCKMVIASDRLPAALPPPNGTQAKVQGGATRDEGGSRSAVRVKGVFVILFDAAAEGKDEK